MPYYLEMQFSDGRWQRNPTPFPTREAVEQEDQKTTAMFQADEVTDAEFRKAGLPSTAPPHYRIISEG